MNGSLNFKPLTPNRWDDITKLFGKNGACGGCWCMWWKLTRSEFSLNKGQNNKNFLRSIVENGKEPGIIAYSGTIPVGWIALAPRTEYPVLDRSPILKPLDDADVWSITCFFIQKEFRNMGITIELLEYAKSFVLERGGGILEGYPIDPKKPRSPDVFVSTGLVSAFIKAGFKEVKRRSETRPIMRFYLQD